MLTTSRQMPGSAIITRVSNCGECSVRARHSRPPTCTVSIRSGTLLTISGTASVVR